jgi:hypothetical protein
MDLAGRLQIKAGMTVAVVGAPPDGPDLAGISQLAGSADQADEAAAVIAFARHRADLADTAGPAIEAARRDQLAWIAYPKAGQLGTDLNRDSLVQAAVEFGVRPVRQVAIDEVWSALRFRPG